MLPKLASWALALSCLSSVNAYINYTTVTGYFLQDDPKTNASTFNFTATNFGLINRTYPSDGNCASSARKTQWQRFADQVATLNAAAPPNTEYKVLYIGRHGEGYHNAAESYYGTPGWNCFWSEKDGNATVSWADARLTPNGVQQALSVNTFWKIEIAEQKIPAPQRYYTSPLTRCLTTANLTFFGLNLPAFHPFVPEVKELLRETISGHTCDRRSSKTYIHTAFPTYTFEDGFSENDTLWEALHGETDVDQDIRSKKVLDDIFLSDSSTYISITSHSGEISSLLRG
jgi:broad specificity phosphatase PhoE